MADIPIVAANFRCGQNAQIGPRPVQFGEAVAQGNFVYQPGAGGKYWLSNNTTAELAAAKAIVIIGAGIDGWGVIMHGGDFDPGSTVAIGEPYHLSAAGGIAPYSDITTGMFVTSIGSGISATTISMRLDPTGVAHA